MVNIPIIQDSETSPFAGLFGGIGAGIGGGISQGVENRLLDKALEGVDVNDPATFQQAVNNAPAHLRPKVTELLSKQLDLKEKAETIPKGRVLRDGGEGGLSELEQILINDGVPKNEAKIWSTGTPAVQATLARRHSEMKSRGARTPLVDQTQLPTQQTSGAELATATEESSPITDWPDLSSSEGLTPAETVKRENQNQRENNKVLIEARKGRSARKGADVRINRLRQLNDTRKVADGIGRVVIDPNTGNPRPTAELAGVVNKETQLFSKTLADFLVEAKDLFGSRVTNFDLQSFKNRLPKLLNTEEGRRVIIEQMDLLNQLELLHKDELVKGIQHYGRKASFSDIAGAVDARVGRREQEIIDRLNRVDEASTMLDKMIDNPEKFKGSELFFDPEDGSFHSVRKSDREAAINVGLEPWK